MLSGRIDTFAKQKIYGWAYDDADFAQKAEIIVSIGDRILARGIANNEREDLKANAVGDGCHAFEIAIADPDAILERMTVVAQTPLSGEVKLSAPTEGDRAIDAVINALSNQFSIMVAELRDRIDSLENTAQDQASLKGEIVDEPLDARLAEIEKRMESLEVFVFRIDESLRKITDGLARNRRKRFLFW